jgi:hypothetical protein
MNDMIPSTLSALAGFALFPVMLLGGLVLYYRTRTIQVLLLSVSIGIACIGRLLQLFAPFEPIYIKDAAGVVTGATATFPPMWYVGSVAASVGIIGMAIFFVWFSLTSSASKKNG